MRPQRRDGSRETRSLICAFFWRAATLCNLARVEVKEVCCSGGHIVAAVIITVFFCGALTAKKNDQGVGVRQ